MRELRILKIRHTEITAHTFFSKVNHGPVGDCKSWPRWKLFRLSVVQLGMRRPSSGWRLWVYVRGNYHFHFDITFDRQHLSPRCWVHCKLCDKNFTTYSPGLTAECEHVGFALDTYTPRPKGDL